MSQPPPGSLGLPYLGKTLAFLKNPFEFTLAGTRAHGNVWKTRILGDTVVFFAGPKAFSFFMDPANFTRQNGSPKLMQELLHADAVPFLDGDRFKARKRLLLSAFGNVALDSYLPSIFQIFTRYCDAWTAQGEAAIAADVDQLAFDIADMLFAAADPRASNRETAADFATMNKGTFAPPIKLPFTAYGRAIKARDRLRAYIKQAVATRDGDGSALGVLKAARGPNGEELSARELEIELLHFYFAAHAGLAAAIAWCIVVLGQHRKLAAALRAEADAMMGDRVPDLAGLDELPRARAVAREVLRAYPIAPTTFFGIAKRDLDFDGYAIRAGWKGAGAIWATLQDGAAFRDPAVFTGDRLGDAALRALPDNAFVPQGGGAREGHRCPGEALVQMVMPAFLAWFARRYELAWPEQDVTPKGGGIGPLPASGVRVRVTKRAARERIALVAG
ncbi:MAG TPA: cytochrome P450 [Kofleriaceae bacterium]|jgi:cytochrome P450